MAINEILLDTNAYTAFKRGDSGAINIIGRAASIYLNAVILGELLGGFSVGSREAKNRAELQQFLTAARVILLPIDDATANYYAVVYQSLRGKGRPIPTNDMWIAATALQHGLALFSYDQHFSAVDGLKVGTTAVELGLT